MITGRQDVSRNRICFVSIPSAESLVWLLIFKAVIKESILSVCSPSAVLCRLIHRSLSCCRICFETFVQVHNLRSEIWAEAFPLVHDLKSVTEGFSHMEEIPLLLGNICAICYESALKEYLQRRCISCRIRRVFSCCCSRHLIAGSANALRKLLRGVAAALGGKEERGRTKNDGNKIRGTSSRMSSRQTVFSSSEKNSTSLRRRELWVLWLSSSSLSFSL